LRNLAEFTTEIHFGHEKPEHTNASNDNSLLYIEGVVSDSHFKEIDTPKRNPSLKGFPMQKQDIPSSKYWPKFINTCLYYKFLTMRCIGGHAPPCALSMEK